MGVGTSAGDRASNRNYAGGLLVTTCRYRERALARIRRRLLSGMGYEREAARTSAMTLVSRSKSLCATEKLHSCGQRFPELASDTENAFPQASRLADSASLAESAGTVLGSGIHRSRFLRCSDQRCPRPQLYVATLDDRAGAGGDRAMSPTRHDCAVPNRHHQR
jgi:hypothetical protein